MKILAFESTAKAAGVCLCEEDKVIAQAYQNSGLTHSTTLMPMAEDLLRNSGVKLDDVDVLAVAVGPGSFTGLRIGISTVKGLAWGAQKPCIGVSTLEVMAWNLAHMDGATICCAMDARRKQVYNALFHAEGGRLIRMCEDRAISLEELAAQRHGCHILVGDGAELVYQDAIARGDSVVLAPPHLRFQSGWGVARCAWEQLRNGVEPVSGAELEANYLRLSQAERERLERSKQV